MGLPIDETAELIDADMDLPLKITTEYASTSTISQTRTDNTTDPSMNEDHNTGDKDVNLRSQWEIAKMRHYMDMDTYNEINYSDIKDTIVMYNKDNHIECYD
jgi:hypothetical protein